MDVKVESVTLMGKGQEMNFRVKSSPCFIPTPKEDTFVFIPVSQLTGFLL